MSVFTEKELEFLKAQRLGRLATVSQKNAPHVIPVAFKYDAETGHIDIGGRYMSKSKKYRDLQTNPAVAFCIDDLVSVQPWTPRGMEIRGRAELHPTGGGERFGAGWEEAWIRIIPERIVAWGIDTALYGAPNARSVG
jgi:pyridoxamine 5'-phosphate oxidase family protein